MYVHLFKQKKEFYMIINYQKTVFFIILVYICIISGCFKEKIVRVTDGYVNATMETDPVTGRDDVADDPCVWVHPTDPSLSMIIGTDKDENSPGLRVYDLDGNQVYTTDNEKANNVDIRYGMKLGGKKVDIVTTGLRVSNTLGIYKIDPDSRSLSSVSARQITLGIEVYGSCMYKESTTNTFYAIVNDKKGNVEQYRLFDNGSGLVDAELVRTLKLPGQLEGCVADDILGHLYIGEEDRGIWKYGAKPGGLGKGVLIDSIGPHLAADVEGLTIYYSGKSTGYLIASSQGDNTYAIYSREGGNKFIGRIAIVDSENIDGTSETDGIDVCNMNLGEKFSNGIFIVQDDVNDKGKQNFKVVPWENISSSFDPPLTINNVWNLRN
jgi:3-phytase